MENALRKFRIEKGLTQADLARALNASKGTISKWENGEAIPRREQMVRIHTFTKGEVSPGSFFGGQQ